jgi:formate hydrogenlyase transcriptional activator
LQKQLEAENTYLTDEITQNHQYGHIIGNHPSLLKVLEEVSQVAPTDASVLINGETVTVKELIARAVHDASKRRDRPLIKVNCEAISENLVEVSCLVMKKVSSPAQFQNDKDVLN